MENGFCHFEKDDFNFVGFSFKHWRENKKTGARYFIVEPTEKSFKDFKKEFAKANIADS